jgi:hypothetical protein
MTDQSRSNFADVPGRQSSAVVGADNPASIKTPQFESPGVVSVLPRETK